MSDGGKGSKPRPLSVDLNNFDSNWDKIFGKKNEKDSDKANQTNQPSESRSVDVQGLQSDTSR